MGCNEREQPVLSNEGLTPAVIVDSSYTPASTATAFPEDAAQALTNTGVEWAVGRVMAVFQVLKHCRGLK